jgi:hypothetical protein
MALGDKAEEATTKAEMKSYGQEVETVPVSLVHTFAVLRFPIIESGGHNAPAPPL